MRWPRWKLFLGQAVVLLVVAAVAAGIGAGPLAVAVAILAGLLLLAGLIGAAVAHGDSVGPGS